MSEGVEELDQEKLAPLLRFRYHDSITDAVADLGPPEEISHVFAGFQKFLTNCVERHSTRPFAARPLRHVSAL